MLRGGNRRAARTHSAQRVPTLPPPHGTPTTACDMPDRPDACAVLARELGEPLPGTAPVATGWLLVEDPGPWGRDGLADGTLPAAVRDRVAAALVGQPIRYQAIRRTSRRVTGPRTVILAHSGPTPWAQSVNLSDDAIADLDPTLTLHPDPPAVGTPVGDPVVLVCTHGKRDACCAERGRPVAAALAAAFRDAVWETSHTGGHRFAPNVILLPSGVTYGFLEGDDAVAAVDDAATGRLHLEYLRGRSGTQRPVQTAEVALRRRLGLDRLEAIAAAEMTDNGAQVEVTLTLEDGERWAAVVAPTTAVPRAVSCGADPSVPEGWEVTSLTPAASAR